VRQARAFPAENERVSRNRRNVVSPKLDRSSAPTTARAHEEHLHSERQRRPLASYRRRHEELAPERSVPAGMRPKGHCHCSSNQCVRHVARVHARQRALAPPQEPERCMTALHLRAITQLRCARQRGLQVAAPYDPNSDQRARRNSRMSVCSSPTSARAPSASRPTNETPKEFPNGESKPRGRYVRVDRQCIDLLYVRGSQVSRAQPERTLLIPNSGGNISPSDRHRYDHAEKMTA
jgi:hypothetical protein